jgi:hypothetical protein
MRVTKEKYCHVEVEEFPQFLAVSNENCCAGLEEKGHDERIGD